MKIHKSMEKAKQELKEQLDKYPLSVFKRDLSSGLVNAMDNSNAREIVLVIGDGDRRDYISASSSVAGALDRIAELNENQAYALENFSAIQFERSEFYPLHEKRIINARPMNLGEGRTVKSGETVCYLATPGPEYEQTRVVALGDFREGFGYSIL